ncbi:MAG TPA: two-component regulator propeller domain-containing protein [Blastocatellia bacterium]|nr:two-component regulator propeller domain-containing protein [Blastocatellia bacterium]
MLKVMVSRMRLSLLLPLVLVATAPYLNPAGTSTERVDAKSNWRDNHSIGNSEPSYMIDRWESDRNFPGGQVHAIAQTPDGYLWIGSEKGLVRFDGLNFRLFEHSKNPELPSGAVVGLAVDARGGLLLRFEVPSLVRYSEGRFESVLPELGTVGSQVTAMSPGSKGEILLSSLNKGVLSTDTGSYIRPHAAASDRPNFLVMSIAQALDGRIWLGTRDLGLFYVDEGDILQAEEKLPDKKINCLVPTGTGELWVGTDNGVGCLNCNERARQELPSSLNHMQVLAIAEDRESNMWIGGSTGLLRLTEGKVSVIERNRPVTALFADREGNLWVGTDRSIERIRPMPFRTYSTADGLPANSNGPVFVDQQARTWFAPLNGGLYWMKDGQIAKVKDDGIGEDVIYSIAGREDEVWVGRQRGGLSRVRFINGAASVSTYTETEGLAQNSVFSLLLSRDGGVWAGTLGRGVSEFRNGRFTNYTTANGLASNTVNAILEAADGTMWFATSNGLSAFLNGRWRVLTASDGLPSSDVNCLLEDSSGTLWVGTAGGLVLVDSGRVHTPATAVESLREPILGLAEDSSGGLWIASSNHVLRVRRDHLRTDALSDTDLWYFGLSDGLQGLQGVKRNKSVVADGHGLIWFALNQGISVVDPARAASGSPPAIVRIQSIFADGSPIELKGAIKILASNRRISFNFAGLSLSNPERVRFRYRLDGFDRAWSEASAAGEAVYTNLSPGSYRFRVIASNSSGQWNSAESSLGFEIQPLFWQTLWFRFLVLLSFALAALAFYRLRLKRLARQLSVRFEERLAERTRIAQEMHDTLLQGLLSASMQLYVAVDRLPQDSPVKPSFAHVIELMRQVIDEGRRAVRGLRSTSDADSLGLAQALSRVQQEVGGQDDIGFRVVVEGHPRLLHPAIRDEVYRIGREAAVNAFRHSRARNIEAEIEYGTKSLRVLVRDDGCGIDPQVLQSGRDGHWGLTGMRERAERIGARLKVWSRSGAGTEVELSVPGKIAFSAYSHRGPMNWLVGLRRARKSADRPEREDIG